MRILVLASILFFSFAVVEAQRPSSFSEVFGITTAELNAKFGKPKKIKKGFSPVDKTVQFPPSDAWVYRSLGGWKHVEFFTLDGKVVMVSATPVNKKMKAADMVGFFAPDFVSVEAFSRKVTIDAFIGQKDPDVPKVYGMNYFMVNATKDAHTVVTVNNVNWKRLLNPIKADVTKYPGYVEKVTWSLNKPQANAENRGDKK